MTAVGYIRVSTQEQAKEGISLEVQEDKIRKYADLHNLGLVEVVRDEGKSGKDLNREGIQKIITLCQKRLISHLIVYKMDRLTRHTFDLLALVEEVFKPNSIQFHSITEKVDTSTAQGKFFLTITAAMAQMERDLISERTKEALQYKKSRLQTYSPTPFGFDEEDGYIKPNTKELEIVKLIKKLRRDGLTYQGIADKLNEEKIPTKNSGIWSRSSTWRILRNPIYDNSNPKRSQGNGWERLKQATNLP